MTDASSPRAGCRCRCSAAARCARSTRSTPSTCCSSRATGSARSTSSCASRSRTRARCSPRSARSGSSGSAASFPSHYVTAGRGRDRRSVSRRSPAARDEIAGRAMLVRRTAPVPFECVVRGYLSGSAWAEYRARGTLAGEPLPAGPRGERRGSSRRSSRRPPRPRAATTRTSRSTAWPSALGPRARRRGSATRASRVYRAGRDSRRRRAGSSSPTPSSSSARAPDGTLLLIDEVMTPDSSRFWPADRYAPGRSQPSFDKQPLRDYLAGRQGAGRLERRSAAAAAAGRRRRRDQPPLPRGVPAAHRPRAGGRRCDSHRAGGAAGSSSGAWVIAAGADRGRASGRDRRVDRSARCSGRCSSRLGRRLLPRPGARLGPRRPAGRRAGRRQGRERHRGRRAGVLRRARAARSRSS